MRSWIVAIGCAIAALAVGPSPAIALDACWPGCMFGSSGSAPAKAARSKGTTTKAAYRPSSAGSSSGSSPRSSGRAYGGSVGGSSGIASYYWQPQRVASGGWFNPNAMTAAHKTLPFGTRVRVTHQGNGRSVDVTINDRGPYIAGRVIDLSKAAAGVINMQGQGIANIRMEVLGR